MAVLGADGWQGRWVVARLDGRTVTLSVVPDSTALLALRDVEVIGIDMPIGLSDDGDRTCDVEARRRLPGAASSVFPAPVRPVLAASDYADARARSLAACGKSLSAQAFALVPAIRSLDDALGDPPDPRVHEIHPEVSFRALDPQITDRKKSDSGRVQRIRALEQEMDVLMAIATAPVKVPVVDALDACAAAWSAQRIAEGRGGWVGDDRRDARGRPMRIHW